MHNVPMSTTTTAAATEFAVIDTDGMRLVVWGLGETEDAARAEAADQEGYEETEWNRVVEISVERAAAIRAGDVGADDLAAVA